MIRETYKGRKIVITRNKNYGSKWQIKINGVVCAVGSRSESDELAWVKGTIDAVDASPKGEARYGAEWYVPGTFEINDNGHVIEIGGACSCNYCAPATAMRVTVTDKHDRDTVDVYDGEPAEDTYAGNVRREHRGWVAWRMPWKGVANGGYQRDAAGKLIHFGSAEDAATFLVPDAPAPVADASGPKGQEQPPAGRVGSRYDHRGYRWGRLPSEDRRNAVRARAGDLYRAGTHTSVKAWDAALNEDFLSHMEVPAEDSFGVCVPVMGGAGHTFTPDGDFPPVPTCRTMDRNSRGTAYRVVDHGAVTCDTCLTYRARRQERRDRIAKG